MTSASNLEVDEEVKKGVMGWEGRI